MDGIEKLKKRSKDFAHRVVKVAESLPKTRLGNHICGQLIRCSTSAAANYRAACSAQSKAAFIAKISIAVEESDESVFWLEFIRDEKLMAAQKLTDILQEASELTAIFNASRKTARRNSRK